MSGERNISVSRKRGEGGNVSEEIERARQRGALSEEERERGEGGV